MPSGWETIAIGDISEAIFDGPHATPKKTDDGPIFLGIGNLKNGRIDLTDAEHLSEDDFRTWTRRVTPQRGDIVFSYETRLGEVALVPENLRFCLGRRMALIRPNKSKVDPRFLLYAYMGPQFNNVIQARTIHGSTVDRIPLIEFPRFPILIPPLPEQRAIADVLGSLDDKIELNRRMNATLESMAMAVFRQWFVESEDANGWKVSSLGELFPGDKQCVLTGPFGSHLHAHDYRPEGTPLILVKHVIDGKIIEDNLPLVGDHKLPEMRRYQLKTGDIVFTRVGAVGRSAYVHPRYEGWLISGQTLRMRVPDTSKLNPRYLAQVYLERSFIEMVEGFALGTTRPSLNTSILQSFKFIVPPIEIQDKFAEIVLSFDDKIQSNTAENRTLAALRDALLPRLMSGEVRVKAEG